MKYSPIWTASPLPVPDWAKGPTSSRDNYRGFRNKWLTERLRRCRRREQPKQGKGRQKKMNIATPSTYGGTSLAKPTLLLQSVLFAWPWVLGRLKNAGRVFQTT